MLVVISPAKTLDFDTPEASVKTSRPRMLNASQELVEELRAYSGKDLQKLMGISEKLGELNAERYLQWHVPFNKNNAKSALFAFKGDVYLGLDAQQFDLPDLEFAQQHLRILSGLYGLLRPLDLIQPYRLEMGTSLATSLGSNLYQFWGERLTKAVTKDLKALQGETLVNLASNEYFSVLKNVSVSANVVTPIFKDYKNGKYKVISFFAKKARGILTAHIIKNRITNIDDIKKARLDGYRFSAQESDDKQWVFLRKAP
jgi:uncharacterized protein